MEEIFNKLGKIQESCGFLPECELLKMSGENGISMSELIGIISFYDFFSLEKRAEKANSRIENIYPYCRGEILLNPRIPYEWNALVTAQNQQPDALISRIAAAKLLGRSGGGFPVAVKWEISKNADGDKKYIICNADEGELFTGKDRVLLERNPWAVIEGMAICANAIGAEEGFIYLRGEYADLRKKLEKAIRQMPAENFKINICQGQGAYVCGEETALLNSIEGKRGEPRLKPPYPGLKGLFGRPTVINNVETFACVPAILNYGADAFSSYGDRNYSGTKLYTLCGAVRYPGVYEMRAGVTVRELLRAAGGESNPLSAVLVGGGGGSLMPIQALDMRMTIEGCAEYGASLGTASIRFISKDENLISLVLSLMKFFEKESCGTCTVCRAGLKQVVRLLEKAESGNIYPEEIQLLKKLAEYIRMNARCGLGQACVTPLLTFMKNFPGVLR